MLNGNRLQRIPHLAFATMKELKIIALSQNPIQTIDPGVFRLDSISNCRIFLLGTHLKTLTSDSFLNLRAGDFKLNARGRIPRTITYYRWSRAWNEGVWEVHLNPVGQREEAIKVHQEYENTYLFRVLQPAMLSMGYTKTATGSDFIFLPCPLGTFSNSSVPNNNNCTECPPGGFYSDTLAYVAEGCKKCPNGSYIAFDKKPGKSILDCKACPLGKKL